MRVSTHDEAMRSRCTHGFVVGRGYIDYGAPPAYPAKPVQALTACDPPIGTKDGSSHVLSAPGSATTRPFTWIVAERAWQSDGGNRLAWPATYLAAHGWRWLYSL